jgi:hypothetical protein
LLSFRKPGIASVEVEVEVEVELKEEEEEVGLEKPFPLAR